MPLPEKNGPQNLASEEGIVLFRELDANSVPVLQLPEDTMTDISYQRFYQAKCVLCNSFWRDRAEHIYIESGKKIMPVLRFFMDYFRARLNHTQVATHMEHHCGFSHISTSGLKNYEAREEEIAVWRFREDALALTALMVELDDIRGIDCNKNNDLKIKRAQVVERLVGKILDVKARRDEAALLSINIFEILADIHDSIEDPESKRIIRNKVTEIRKRMTQEAKE